MRAPDSLRHSELLRCALLTVVALLLTQPYFSPRLIGTGDALWNHHLLADAVTQFRAGVFPVFVGQSDFSFNGAVYPIRAAPYYQYFAGFLDLVTGRSLGFFALQHLTVILSVLAGIFSSYLALAWIAPDRRWTAAGLAALYVLCPGVAGLFYAQDLYMSTMTLPWVPLACAAMLRAFDDDSLLPPTVLAFSLAALWWAHSPIALWATLIATAVNVVLLVRAAAKKSALRRAAVAVALFALLAAYPVISVFLLRTPGETIVPYLMDRTELLREVRAVFPASLLPLNAAASSLTLLQLGYALWLALAAAAAGWCCRCRLSTGLLLSSAVFLLILVFPVPGITRALWFSFPETLVGMTLYWPMQRLYILIAALTIVCAQRALADLPVTAPRPARFAVTLCLLLGLLWSAREFTLFIRRADAQADTVADSRRWARSENIAIQRHTYGLFSGRPAYFTHGVVDPRIEFRLLDPANHRIIASNYPSPSSRPFSDEFSGVIDANPGILNLRPALTLTPGEPYFLTLEFTRPDTTGVLQLIGDDFYREYTLPLSGEALAFGSPATAEKSIALWTTAPSPRAVQLRFIPTAAGARASDYIPFARYRFSTYDPSTLPVRVDSLIPLRARVRSSAPALVETPRMSVPGYVATVNGVNAPVHKSPQGLVTFPVPAGDSIVELRFVGPLALRVAFWLSFGGWICGATGLGVALARRKLHPNPCS